MTSVPKPLKFLRPHYEALKDAYSGLQSGDNKRKLADVISVLAITSGKDGERESLKYKLLGSKVMLIFVRYEMQQGNSCRATQKRSYNALYSFTSKLRTARTKKQQ